MPFNSLKYSQQEIIEQTKKWINDVVIGCNFCPFAAPVVKKQSIHYQVEMGDTLDTCMASFSQEISRFYDDNSIDTTFVIFPNAFQMFPEFLKAVTIAELLLKQKGYRGIFQLATFHPLYEFAGSGNNDAANYTNRSLYPMLHILREAGISNALENFKHPEVIPERNIVFARKKGLDYMSTLLKNCHDI